MANKLALVVDDSRSARLVLRRMLEKYDLDVETVESAAAALDYLTGARPDVIFMDHMMPGMDGFEAVRRIKADPDTATIPVMMYTSKGGDLYLGQARALGAVGILPKTVAPAELYAALQRLGLVQERRSRDRVLDEDGASERQADIRRRRPAAAGESLPVRQPDRPLDTDTVRALLEEQSVEMRKDLLLGFDAITRQIHDTLGPELDDRLEKLKGSLDRAAQPSPLPMILLTVLLFVSLAWNYALQRGAAGRQPQQSEQAAATTPSAAPQAAPLPGVAAAASTGGGPDWQLAAWVANQNLGYDYDELALDKGRVDFVRELLQRLRAAGFRGRVVLETHVGEFCLRGNNSDGFRLAAPDLPVTRCALIGNPVQPTDLPSAHQSLRFANLIGSAALAADGIEVEVANLPRQTPLAPYPPKSEQTTAAEWNRAARLNNRVRVRFEVGGGGEG